jgi:SnoaL-like polyketide cyclase
MSMTESASTLPGVGSPLRLAPFTNLERMYALDEAWNARDWDTFDAYHEQSDVVVYWPGREGTPTHGGRDHRAESIRFCAAFPDNKVKHPYDILFGDGEFTAFITLMTGTFTGPLELPDGKRKLHAAARPRVTPINARRETRYRTSAGH